MASITSGGIGSGIDLNGLIKQLIDAEGKARSIRLDTSEAKLTATLSALGTVKSAFSEFNSAIESLKKISTFNIKTATTSDSNVLSLSADNTAVAGSYSITVDDIAAANKLKSGPFSNSTSTVGSGTLTIQYGTYDSVGNTFTLNPNKSAQTIVIPTSSNTLQGIRDAINEANADVSASIINDGASFRLVLTSKETGAANSIKVTVTDNDGNNNDNSGLSKLAYDPTLSAGNGKNLEETVAEKMRV